MAKKTWHDLFRDYIKKQYLELSNCKSAEEWTKYYQLKDLFDIGYSTGKEDGIKEVCNGVEDILLQ